MPELEIVAVEPAGWCDPSTGVCVTEEEPAEPVQEDAPETDGTA